MLNKGILIIGIIFVAFNLRPALTSVGPLIDTIRLDIGISHGVAGFLTALPLLAFAALSLFAPQIGRRLGHERTILYGLIILSIGIFLRSSGSVFLLFFGTVLIGVGIAICNVILPGIIKQKYPDKVGLMTGIYTTSMGIGATIAAGLSIPLTKSLNSWNSSLAIWAIFAVISLLLWLPQVKKRKINSDMIPLQVTKISLWHSTLAWQVTIFMGFQSLLFYCLITWLPAILINHGLSIAAAGWMLSLLQLTGIPASFVTPILADRFPDQRGIVLGIATFSLIGLVGLLFVENTLLLIIFITFIGLAQGAYISLALTFLGLRTRNAEQAANLSGMAQSIGYLLAAFGPITIGFIYDTFQTWALALVIFIFISIAILITGLGAGRNQAIDVQQVP